VVAHKEQGGQCAIEDSPDSVFNRAATLSGGKGSGRGKSTREYLRLETHHATTHLGVKFPSWVVTIDLRKAKRAEGWRKVGASGTGGVPRGGEDALPT